MEQPQDVQAVWRAWLKRAVEGSGLKPTPFAENAGLAASTVIRALDENHPGQISLRTINKIVAHYRIAPPFMTPSRTNSAGFNEPEVEPFDGPLPVGETTPTDPNHSLWELKTRALELAGYLPGDILTLDQSEAPLPGDVVCAQIYDLTHDTAETVFRRLDEQFLVTDTMDPSLRGQRHYIDGQRVKILGVVVKSVRSRAGGLAPSVG